MNICKPFVKWVGGKSKLLQDIEKALPVDFAIKRNITYAEPFVGGGAVLFWILQKYPNISHAVINDINADLTGAYRAVQRTPKELIEFLSEIEAKYYELGDENKRKDFFLEKREIYNFEASELVERAGLFMFLNRTCFNGLYRVNKKGYFNVPFGKYSSPKICDSATILSDSELLQRVEILTGDFSQTLDYISTDNAFFYFDPPYKPISTTSSFTSYAKDGFLDEDQMRLAKFCDEITKKGYTFLLSNSDLKNVNPEDNYLDNLYVDFEVKRVRAPRMINSKASGRGLVSEILVSNRNIINYEGAF